MSAGLSTAELVYSPTSASVSTGFLFFSFVVVLLFSLSLWSLVVDLAVCRIVVSVLLFLLSWLLFSFVVLFCCEVTVRLTVWVRSVPIVFIDPVERPLVRG